uniref:SMP-30/Gluconolactonase/LRE-like region domain-containing protein n=1 Tax=Emiliania huxleyi TaxID=2903 RepID=A0A7S3WYA5_EMIHU|mmetsp:Transcript_26785/g.79935  ORF Transcript_26785/g.79935 Transcript_26785/m.79935 type:complete len:399 (-) Transcript_26785:63-1259(-)
MARLAVRLRSLPLEELVQFAAEALETQPSSLAGLPHKDLAALAAPAISADAELSKEADRRIALHAPIPEWALSKVLVSQDLAPLILNQLEVGDYAAAKVCKTWRCGWLATVAQRPWLRPAPTQPPPLDGGDWSVSAIVALDGERFCMCAEDPDNDFPEGNLLVLNRSFQVLQTIPYQQVDGLAATQHGLCGWCDDILSRYILTDSSLDKVAEVALGFLVCDVICAPDGTLFASTSGRITSSGCGFVDSHARVVAFDPLTLEQKFKCEPGHLNHFAFRGIAVVGTELFVCDSAAPEGQERYGRFQVFALTGEYLREVRVSVPNPTALQYINGRLYVTDYAFPRDGPHVFVLTPEGEPLQHYQHEAFSLAIHPVCPFAGGLLLRADQEGYQNRLAFLSGL